MGYTFFSGIIPPLSITPVAALRETVLLVYNTGTLKKGFKGLTWTLKTNAPIIFM